MSLRTSIHHRPRAALLIFGYLFAVVVGTILYVLFEILGSSSPMRWSGFSLITVIFLPYAIMGTVPGFLVAAYAAYSWRIGGLLFYASAGMANGLLAPLIVSARSPGPTQFPLFLAAGFVGGVVYWLVTKPRRPASSAPHPGHEKGNGAVPVVALSVIAYVLTILLFFGDVLAPLNILVVWLPRLGADAWRQVALVAMACALLVFAPPIRNRLPRVLRFPVFVALLVALPTLSVGFYVDTLKAAAVREFGADEVVERSFFQAIRQGVSDFQLNLHTAAIKDCVPYAWSYRTMSFYVVPPNAAVNVMPNEWVKRCGIE